MRIFFIIVASFATLVLTAQTNISGYINSYHKIIEIITAKACVRVDNTSGLLNNDMVMLVQMKGATVSTGNNSSFGTVSAMNNAGNYEINFICSIRGDSVFLFKQILQSYTVTDKVQLVRVPQYSSALVTDSLKALPWDSASGKGGVLALSVSDDLILNAPVSANHSGYKGGAFALSNGTCANILSSNSYYYNAINLAPQNGSYKGESVVTLGLAYSGGKGAVANGGGGGNNHNNGGGGGSNLAAGGLGGGNSSSAGCTVANAGRGAYPLSNSQGLRIFMGGGGGAGHANSGVISGGGGKGGGIIFIHANTIYSNGNKILANGQQGGSTIGDGASGGGAGGTIILDVNNYADALNAESAGGKGGNEDDQATSQRCYGEGGGGSGGIIFFKTAAPAGTISVAGGLKGDNINSLNCGVITAGTAGAAGSIVPSYTYMQSSTLSNSCGIFPLPVHLLNFDVTALSNTARLEWKCEGTDQLDRFVIERKINTEAWKGINVLPASNSAMLYNYQDKGLVKAVYQYRLKIVENNGDIKYSPVKTITIGKTTQFVLFPNPAHNTITIVYPFHSGSQLKIFNGLGQLVFQKNIGTAEMLLKQDISFLKKGMYRVVVDLQSSTLIVQ